MFNKQKPARVAVLAGAITVTVVLAGCSSDAEGDSAPAGTTTQATEAASDTVNSTSAEPVEEDSDATASADVPEGFPSEVPLVSGDVIDSTKLDRGTYVLYTVTVADERAPADVLASLPAQFTGWGLTFEDDTSSQFTSNELGYSVTVTATARDSGSSVEYDVPVPSE
ncbi:hypothetical protein [Demequina flava]|uniref:hypothetical protein n=1 Tax=Demequina flava TaxID=1095025 RepID=UPI0007867C07|nr:hypothetical protein [Demequina flava]